jgi:N-terminal domain of galactosyltransferase
LVLHDVDLMPIRLGQLYACSVRPRHMCSSLDQFRYHLPYYGLFGGVVAIDSSTFQFINGMSNLYEGWGGEDDDLYGRLLAKNIDICRFEEAYSLYTMLKHAPEKPNADRLAFLRDGPTRYHSDGMNSLVFKEVAVKLTKYYTHIMVET